MGYMDFLFEFDCMIFSSLEFDKLLESFCTPFDPQRSPKFSQIITLYTK